MIPERYQIGWNDTIQRLLRRSGSSKPPRSPISWLKPRTTDREAASSANAALIVTFSSDLCMCSCRLNCPQLISCRNLTVDYFTFSDRHQRQRWLLSAADPRRRRPLPVATTRLISSAKWPALAPVAPSQLGSLHWFPSSIQVTWRHRRYYLTSFFCVGGILWDPSMNSSAPCVMSILSWCNKERHILWGTSAWHIYSSLTIRSG